MTLPPLTYRIFGIDFMTKLSGDSKLKRTIKVYGISEPVVVTLDATGVEMQVKGSRQAVYVSWSSILAHSNTPTNCKGHHFGRPLALLTSEAIKVAARREKKENNATTRK